MKGRYKDNETVWAVVDVVAKRSEDLSSNPAEVYSFYYVNCLKRTKINKKKPEMAHFKLKR